MLADERDGYPMSFRVCVTLEGPIDRSRFHAAVRGGEALQPLLQAVIEPIGCSSFQWIYSGPGNIGIRWHNEVIDFDAPQPIDLTRESGIRIHLHTSSESTQLLLLAHHGCVDAIGAVEFLTIVLDMYRKSPQSNDADALGNDADALGNDADALGNDDLISLLKQRGRLLPKRKQEESQNRITDLARETLRVIANPPSPLIATSQPIATEQRLHTKPFGDILTDTFNQNEVEILKGLARIEGVSVNDLLLRDLFCTMQQWNQQRQAHKETRLRITIPVNMRPPLKTNICANVLSYCFVTRTAKECQNPEELLRGIHRETTAIKRDQLGTHLLYALDLVRKISGGMQLVLRNPCISTTVLSNLGDISNVCPQLESLANELTVKSFTFIPPVRPGTRAVFAVSTFRGSLSISLTTDPHYFDANDAEELQQQFLAKIKTSMKKANPLV
ncbi:MAG: NRPS condensation-like uncharacterized protein [Pirellulaceae bacterium]|jgi:NRPS condensation-like uncharacterized protein